MPSSSRAIIRITANKKSALSINYSRRMYAIIRRYTPEAVEGASNECFAELTGLRTFFKMTYNEMAQSISDDLYREIGIRFIIKVAKVKEYEDAVKNSKKSKHISTYKEMNKLFAGRSLGLSKSEGRKVTGTTKKIRFTIPFLGKVA
jgi:nucleotidyltransferase/DNA polymerase involved in DNA repair